MSKQKKQNWYFFSIKAKQNGKQKANFVKAYSCILGTRHIYNYKITKEIREKNIHVNNFPLKDVFI